MFYSRHLLFVLFISGYAQSEYEVIITSDVDVDEPVEISDGDKYWINNWITGNDGDKVDVQLYYESLCPDCIKFDKEQFCPAVQKLNEFVNFQVYPYGNAKTIKKDGTIEFECQHGPPECYGNKLHACALDLLKNFTEAVEFNSCMMGGKDRGSNDEAADRCAAALGIDSSAIKTCAKGDRGTQLLEYYGEESKKANFSYVPYILINGKVNDGSNLMRDICSEFTAIAPPPCAENFNLA